MRTLVLTDFQCPWCGGIVEIIPSVAADFFLPNKKEKVRCLTPQCQYYAWVKND